MLAVFITNLLWESLRILFTCNCFFITSKKFLRWGTSGTGLSVRRASLFTLITFFTDWVCEVSSVAIEEILGWTWWNYAIVTCFLSIFVTGILIIWITCLANTCCCIADIFCFWLRWLMWMTILCASYIASKSLAFGIMLANSTCLITSESHWAFVSIKQISASPWRIFDVSAFTTNSSIIIVDIEVAPTTIRSVTFITTIGNV